MNYLINYANDAYKGTQKFNSWTGKNVANFDRVIEYSDNDIDEEFYKKNNKILDNKRGAGLWLWKPYFIEKTLREVEDRDIVFYCDAGAYFIRRPNEIMKIMEKTDFWVSKLPLCEKQFTKKAVIEFFGVKKIDLERPQYQGSFFAIRKTPKNLEIVHEWLEACQRDELIEPPNSLSHEKDYFIAHREDQSILSVILKKRGVIAHQDPTQYSRFPEFYWREFGNRIIKCENSNTEYKPCIILHRRKKVNLKILLMPIYYFCLPKEMVLRITGR